MALPSFASFADFAARTPGGVPASESGRVGALLADASALVRAEAGRTWVNTSGQLENVPDIVAKVTLDATRRSFDNPSQVESESVEGEYSVTYPPVELSGSEKSLVRRAAGRPGVWTLSVTRTVDDIPDVPSVYPYCTPVGVGSGAPEETDPFGEGWPG